MRSLLSRSPRRHRCLSRWCRKLRRHRPARNAVSLPSCFATWWGRRHSPRASIPRIREIVGAYYRVVADTVTRFAGFVAKYMGDGVLVYFGYPEAREDDAERAVRAGLAVIDSIDTGRLADAHKAFSEALTIYRETSPPRSAASAPRTPCHPEAGQAGQPRARDSVSQP